MFDSPTYESEKNNTQDLFGLKEILSNYLLACKKLHAEPHIVFTGGDPLLHPSFLQFCSLINKENIPFSILGNPYHLTDIIAKRLKKLGLESYQMSIDGLEKTHDYFRKSGSFKKTITKFKLLKDNNIKSVCMFTLSNKNKDDIIPIIEYINNKVDVFDFARLVPIGNGKELKNDLIDPKEYKILLLRILKKYLDIQEVGSTTAYGRKDHLWKLLYKDLGLLDILPGDDLIYDGCHAGITHLTIISDGTVLLCRRLPIILGNARIDDIYKLFINNKQIKKFRNVDKRKKCNHCELLRFCRGCPAIGYALTNDMFAIDPQCWG
jgi:radical SAM/SPASM domain protein of ACGX system